MCANSEGSGKIVRMCRLAWAFPGGICDKYHNLMSWLIYDAVLNKFYYYKMYSSVILSTKKYSKKVLWSLTPLPSIP